MDTGKNELSPEILEAIREVIKEEIGNTIINQHPLFSMLESERIFMDEQERLKEHPLKGVLGHVTSVMGDWTVSKRKLLLISRKSTKSIFNNDQFKDSLERLKVDAGTFCMAGRYEIELCKMLIEAFKNAEPVKYGRWVEKPTIAYCSCCHVHWTKSFIISLRTTYKYCPNCGAIMDGGAENETN